MNWFVRGRSPESERGFEISRPIALWAIFFCYSTFAALLVQKLLLPLVPSLHAGHGLLTHDSAVFHAIAVSLAESIKQHGWSSWTWIPAPGATGNIAVLAALYALFGEDPSVMIPLNASVHALGGVMIFLLGRRLWPGEVGTIGGLIAGVLFIVFPSALTWYGQIHKDGYTIAGLLLILYAWVRAASSEDDRPSVPNFLAANLVAVLLIGFVRPYFLTIVFVAVLCVFAALTLLTATRTSLHKRWRLVSIGVLGLALLGTAAWAGSKVRSSDDSYARWDGNTWREVSGHPWEWHGSSLLPGRLEKYIETAARTRAGLIEYGLSQKAGSMVDADIAPDSVPAVLAYAPRALEISLLAPFPSMWSTHSLLRLVGSAETLVWYLLIPGVFLTLYRRRSPALVVCLVYCLFFLYVLGFIHANVGTLYRYRYPFLAVFILLGAMGWVSVLGERFAVFRLQTHSPRGPSDFLQERLATETSIRPSRERVARSGAAVIVLTLLGYLGFFLRDALMTRRFGLTGEVDVFYSAIMLAMLLVAVFSFPIGDAVTPALLESTASRDPRAAAKLASSVALLSLALCGFLGAGLVFAGPLLLPLVGRSFDEAKLHSALLMLAWVSPILVLSGISILGNSILNSMGKPRIAAAAQLVVPVAAVGVLLALGGALGVKSVALGMVLGSILNLALLVFYLGKEGLSLWPAWGGGPGKALREYGWLVTAALCANIAIPINYAFASNLHDGSVAAWAIGNRVVLFFTGLIGIGITSVVLPHFSALTSQRRDPDLRRELLFFVMAGTMISMILATALSLASDPIIRLAFEGGRFVAKDTALVGRVVRYGIVQLPFVTMSLLFVKFAVASKRSWQVLLASLLGVCVNILLDEVLLRPMGVAGIALANALAAGASAFVMLAVLLAMKSIRWMDATMLALSWMLFLTLILCLHYASVPGIVVSLLAMIILFAAFWREWERTPEEGMPRAA